MIIYTDFDNEFTPTWLYIKQHNQTKLKYFGMTRNDPHTYSGSGHYWKRHLRKHGKDISTLWCHKFTNRENLVNFALLFSEQNNIVKSAEWANEKYENGIDGGGTITDEMINSMLETRIRRRGTTKTITAESITRGVRTRFKNKNYGRSQQSIEKQLSTRLQKYGTLNISTPETIAKGLQTKIIKYGSLNFTTPSSIQQGRETKLKKYGSLNTNTTESIEKANNKRAETRKAKILDGIPLLSETGKANMRKPKRKVCCPHCNKIGGSSNMKRYHFDNCRFNCSVNCP